MRVTQPAGDTRDTKSQSGPRAVIFSLIGRFLLSVGSIFAMATRYLGKALGSEQSRRTFSDCSWAHTKIESTVRHLRIELDELLL
jgi:hypothetical protein